MDAQVNEGRFGSTSEYFRELIRTLCDHPLIGSLRFADEIEIPDLRSWSLQRFPYLVFYVPDDETIWRVDRVDRVDSFEFSARRYSLTH